MRLTHRRESDTLSERWVILFCDSDRNAGYGDHVWELKTELPPVGDRVVEYAAEFFGVDFDEAKSLVNPEDIVASAGAWDDPQFVSEVWEFCGNPSGFRTPDGAVVLDRYSVDIVEL